MKRSLEVSRGTFLELYAKIHGKRPVGKNALSLEGIEVVITRESTLKENDGRRQWSEERIERHKLRMQQHAEMRKAMRDF